MNTTLKTEIKKMTNKELKAEKRRAKEERKKNKRKGRFDRDKIMEDLKMVTGYEVAVSEIGHHAIHIRFIDRDFGKPVAHWYPSTRRLFFGPLATKHCEGVFATVEDVLAKLPLAVLPEAGAIRRFYEV